MDLQSFIPKIMIPKILGTLLIIVAVVDIATGLFLLFHVRTHLTVGMDQSLNQTLHIQQGSNVAMILFGLFLLRLGQGLFVQKKRAWMGAEIFLGLSFINSMIPPISTHTATFSLILMLILAHYRRYFYRLDQAQLNYQKTIAWMSVCFAVGYGIMGSYLLRDQFRGIHSWIDAMYYTFVTYSTVGYGDTIPLTENAKLFTVSMILVGIASFLTALSVLLGPLIQRNIKGVYNMVSNFSHLNQHLLLCGDNLLTRTLAQNCLTQGKPCFFMEPLQSAASVLESAGFNVIHINPENPADLSKVNLNQALALVSAYDSDAQNILVMMAAQSLKKTRKGPPLHLIARIEQDHNVEKAKISGATEVFSPLLMGADWISKLLA